MKTIVYIDGQNFLYRCATVLIENNLISDKQDLKSFDIKSLMLKILPYDKYEIRYYSAGKIKQYKDFGSDIQEKARRFSDNLRILQNNIRSQGIIYDSIGRLF